MNLKKSKINEGYTCSESIILQFSEYFDYNIETALKMSCGLSGGLAQGKTCGAVVAAFMIISYKYSIGKPNDSYTRDLVYMNVQEFSRKFCEKNSTIECKEILANRNIDFHNSEEMKKLREKDVCSMVVKEAAGILSQVLKKEF